MTFARENFPRVGNSCILKTRFGSRTAGFHNLAGLLLAGLECLKHRVVQNRRAFRFRQDALADHQLHQAN